MSPSGNNDNHVILSVTGIKKYFPVKRGFFKRTIGWIKAVDGVDFEIQAGKSLGLVGESGCGKTTVARLVLKLLEPDGGKLLYKGTDITRFSPKEMRPLRREMQIVFQDPFGSLNPRMTVGQTVEEGLRASNLSREARKARVKTLLDQVGMAPSSAERYPHEFSGGQRQRIGIARALSVEPDLIVCDEPVSALDVSIQAQIINLLKDLQGQLGLSYLFITHDLNVVGYLSDHISVMYLGHIMEHAEADEIFERPYHPYTLALLAAVPKTEPDGDREMKPLGGEPPSAFNPPVGCHFQGRCPLVEDRCRERPIELYDKGQGHKVRCWKVV